jgi:general secretion pathway protein E/type IV pilus assembly protein PilB
VAEKDDYLLDLLVDLGFTDAETVAKSREEANAAGVGVVDLLVANKVIRPGDVTQAKAAQFGAEVVHLTNMKIEDDVIAIVPRDIAKKYRVVPVFKSEGKVAVAIADPSDLNTIDSLTHLLHAEIELRVASEPDIEAALAKYYGGEKKSMDAGIFKDVIQELTLSNVEVKMDDGGDLDADAPLIRLVNQIVVDAFKLRASDIHLEPLEKRFRLRYRIDGMLQEMKSPPKRLQAPVIARLKIQAGMVISEHRVPQDGRIQSKVGNKVIDLRVSCLPTNHGESIVMRILDKEGLRLGLPELGFLTDDQQTFERIIALPDGILLVTGPTGSGKTTTLYGAIEMIRTGREKILTVEDPVEYELAGVPQVPVNEKVGVTFAAALRSLLRQDPDIILVGEIRDAETAQIATQAALTGHLVLSTLHTNDAPTALTRLLDLDIAAYLVASTVDAVLAQRLVRVICASCKTETRPDKAAARRLDVEALGLTRVWKGTGCPECRGTGYRGRTGVYELLVMDNELRLEVQRRRGSEELRAMAVAKGMRTLLDDGVRAAREGVTTLDEVLRVARA